MQLAYCDTIIQRNARVNLPVVGNLSNFSGVACDGAKPLLLDSFFPFDPYRLKNSSVFVESIYRKYQVRQDLALVLLDKLAIDHLFDFLSLGKHRR